MANCCRVVAKNTADIFSWPGPDVHLIQSSARSGIENKCFALTACAYVRAREKPRNTTSCFAFTTAGVNR